MEFNEYQNQAMSLATYPNIGSNILYPAMGLAGEAGEALDKVKKNWRNHGLTNGKEYSAEQRLALAKELGDNLWYISATAQELGYTMEEIAQLNLDKLFDRHERGVLKSEGDNR